MNSNELKIIIANWCKSNPKYITNQFANKLTQEELAESFKSKNWKRAGKEVLHDPTFCKIFDVPVDSIERSFDCKPFDDQLRAYVYTDPTDTIVLKFAVHGE